VRSSIIGLSSAAVVGISIVALPQALEAQSAPSTPRSAVQPVAAAAAPSAASVTSLGATSGTYPTNTTKAFIQPMSRSYSGPTTVRFSGTLVLNKTGVMTHEVRIFSVRDHAPVATVSTSGSGAWEADIRVNRSDLFFAMYSGSDTYQPTLSGISRIRIGNPPAAR